MKIAIIGPGLMSIPPTSWGAVEILIWDYYQNLVKLNHEVKIFNTRDLQSVKDEIESSDFDFVHLHYDDYLPFFENIKHNNFAVTSHYGYLTREEKYEPYYWKIFESFLNTKHKIIALSDKIKEQYLKYNKNLNVIVQRNGASITDFHFNEECVNKDRTLYLGRIEKRKLQHLYSPVDGLNIDFVGNDGPLYQVSKDNKFLGPWQKKDVYKNMTNYANLMLISEGEAHALVCVEALAAGLGVVVNEESSANLDLNKDFITVIPNNKIHNMEYVREKIIQNRNISINKRKEIRQYAEEKFNWEVIVKEYINKI